LGEKETKNRSEGKNKRKKNSYVGNPDTRSLALDAFPAFQYSIDEEDGRWKLRVMGS